VILADLSFAETLIAGVLSAASTALFVVIAAGFVVKRYEVRAAGRQLVADQLHEDRLQARQLEYEARTADRLREAAARHEEQLQNRQLEHQARATLRETYAQLLVAQRRSREASVKLARAGGASGDPELETQTVGFHDEFIGFYHQLNLDASKPMWDDARDLRRVLDELLAQARHGNTEGCEALRDDARSARQNLERSFRMRLGYEPLQDRQSLGH
jgi:hypothetical protein